MIDKQFSYDEKCGELAEYFLQDNKKVSQLLISKLAQTIQDAIEEWLKDLERSL